MLKSIDKLVVLLEGTVRGVRATSRRLVGLVLPFWAKASDYRAWGPGLRWSLRMLFLAVVFFGVWQLHKFLDPEYRNTPSVLRGPKKVQEFWLATLVDLIILFFWIGYWVWQLWMQEEEESPFPDIDEAWEE